jgi:hypothetical protein
MKTVFGEESNNVFGERPRRCESMSICSRSQRHAKAVDGQHPAVGEVGGTSKGRKERKGITDNFV